MLDKKNKQKNTKGKTADKNEKVGLIVSIASVFFLFCILTRSLILGVVGEFIYKVITGVIGCVAYPLFLFTLVWGIVKTRNMTFSVKRKYVIIASVVFFCVMQILQIATTYNSAIKYLAYGDYLGAVYTADLTAGGILFGLFAYPFAKLLSDIGAYVVLSIIILATLMVLSPTVKRFLAKTNNKATENQEANENSEEVTADGSNGLFIETIKPRRDNFYESNPPLVKNNFNEYSEVDSYTRTQTDEYWEKLINRRNARKTLFEDNDKVYEKFNGSTPEEPKNSIEWGNNQSSTLTNNYFTTSGSNNVIEDISRPEPQQYFNASEIINGDAESKKIAEQTGYDLASGTVQSTTGDENNFAAIKAEVKSVSSVFETEMPVAENINKGFDFSSLPPIINGDKFENKEEEIPTSDPYQYHPEVLKPQKEEQIVPISPIINADTYKSNIEYETAKQTYFFDGDKSVDDILNENRTVEDSKMGGESMSVQVPVMQEEISDSCDDYVEITDQKDIDMLNKPTGIIVGDSYVNSNDNSKEIIDEALDLSDDNEIEAEGKEENCEEGENLYTDHAVSDLEEPEESDIIAGGIVFDGNDTIEHEDQPFSYSEAVENDEVELEEDFTAHLTEDEKEKLREEEFKKNTSFTIIDEVEDLSENSNQSSEAINEYYSEMVHIPEEEKIDVNYNIPNSKVNKLEGVKTGKNQPIKGQISIADYAPEVEKEPEPAPKKVLRPYVFPKLEMLTCESTPLVVDEDEAKEKIELLEYCLENLSIPAKVIGITKGPAVTRYELDMPPGMRVSKIESLSSDIKYNLACKHDIRIQTPIPGKRAVGIEVPNDSVAMVGLKDILDSDVFRKSSSPLTLALGKDIQGNIITTKLDKLPHLLIAGTTGSGKSACLNCLIISLIYKSSPEDVKLILVDPKCVEFVSYNGLPHMLIPNAITDVNQAIKAFSWVRDEMNRRYKVLQEHRFRNIEEYNNSSKVKNKEIDKLPYIVFIVDEYAELMCNTGGSDKKKILEQHIQSLTQKARAAGIHLVLATQRPSRDVVTGTIKSNLPAKIAFKVSSGINSQVILDKLGAESLVGRGDMLFLDPTSSEPIRVQGAYVENEEVQNIVEFIKSNNDTDFSEEFQTSISEPEPSEDEEEISEVGGESSGGALEGYDKDIELVARMVLKSRNASGSMIQRRFNMGYVRAVKIVDQLESLGFIGPLTSSNKREVLITSEKFKELFGKDPDDESYE
ncbi:MAG: DUF87 domain-containing protein [Clostridiales bacterium]|nr:DUF87 domain-containing protein [Clostridiales bacterium]